ncbi:MAG: domain containing protein [Myxococcales bacterium]|nr:domain containing protein [Myxococcales bacterium]
MVLGATGVASAAPARKPTLSVGTPEVSGALEAKVVGGVIKRSKTKLLACYKKALASEPALEGLATATFTIGGDGKVTTAAATGLVKDFAACVVATMSKVTFAKPKDKQPVEVSFALRYEPDTVESVPVEGSFASLTGNSGVSSGFDDGNVYRGPLNGKVPDDGKASVWGAGTTAGAGKDGTSPSPSPTPMHMMSIGVARATGAYDAALVRRHVKHNAGKLQYCYEKQLQVDKTLHGTLNAALTVGSDGLVRSATATGLGNKNVESCVAAVIKAIEFPRPKAGDITATISLTFRPAD